MGDFSLMFGRLARRRPARVLMLVACATGWALLVFGACLRLTWSLAIGGAIAAIANLAALKSSFESASQARSVEDRLGVERRQRTSNTRALTADVLALRNRLDTARIALAGHEAAGSATRACIDQLEGVADQHGREIESIEVRTVELGKRLDESIADTSSATDQLFVRLEVLHEALAQTRQLLERVSVRVPTIDAARLNVLARQVDPAPMLSIAVPSFNRPDLLAECLASIEREVAAGYEDVVEVFILDDASTDPATMEVAAAFAESHRYAALDRQSHNVGIERNVIGVTATLPRRVQLAHRKRRRDHARRSGHRDR